MNRKKHITIWLLPLFIVLIGLISFNTVNAQEPVVRAVLFYSSSCGHCHLVMTEHLPPLVEKYGDRLQIMVISIETEGGQALFNSAVETFNIDYAGVPLLIIADQYLIGSAQIPEVFPKLVEQYMAAGGIDWPTFPGMDQAVAGLPTQSPSGASGPATDIPNSRDVPPAAAQVETPSGQNRETGAAVESATDLETAGPTPASDLIFPEQQNTSLIDRLKRDLDGNLLAISVLIAMIVLLVITLPTLWRNWTSPNTGARSWTFVLLVMIGLAIAGYLAWVEIQQVEAVCGPVGDCNTVQQSRYARLFGVLPIGVLGVIGYCAILIAWLTARLSKGHCGGWAVIALRSMTLIGVLFSVYLTFLEPFIIGATCAWCLSSAVIMSALYSMTLLQEEKSQILSDSTLHPNIKSVIRSRLLICIVCIRIANENYLQ